MHAPLPCSVLVVCGLAAGVAARPADGPGLPLGPAQTVGGPFTDRSSVLVYNAAWDQCPSDSFSISSGSSYVAEDVSFSPGPFGAGYAGPRQITRVSGVFQTSGWAGTPIFPGSNTPQCFITQVYEFWDAGSFTATPMLSGAAPFATRSIPTNFGTDYAWPYAAVLNPVVDVGTRVSVWVAVRAIDPATGARIPDGGAALQQPAGQSDVSYGVWLGRVGDACVGHSAPDYGRDENPVSPFGGILAGGASYIVGSSPGNTNDRRRTSATAGAERVVSLGLWGNVTPDVPPAEPVCPLSDGATTRVFTPPLGVSVQWYQLCLGGPVADEAFRYLSVDTEGSAQAMALALYTAAGALVATDNGSGSGANSQLTFGIGRSAGIGDGAQYDGRDGQLAAGTYYLAVAGPGTAFTGDFGFSPAGHTAGAVTVNMRTNLNSGGGLPPLVPPAINHADFVAGGAWGFPAADTLQGATGGGFPGPGGDASSAVLWSRFTLAAPGATDAGLVSSYLDIDAGQSAGADNVLSIFNSAGDLVAYSDDQVVGINLLPLMSFGARNPARSVGAGSERSAGNAPGVTWEGQTGELPAGTYYAACAAWPTDMLTGQGGSAPTAGPGRRFHVRGRSPGNTAHSLRFYTGTGFNCDPIDFNNDGLFPDTTDLDDFLTVFAGGVCSTGACGDIDFNNDGLFPDTLDVDAFLNVFSGGVCQR